MANGFVGLYLQRRSTMSGENLVKDARL